MSALNPSAVTIASSMDTQPPQPTARRSPRIIALPPLVFAAAVLAGIALNSVAPAPFTPGGHALAIRSVAGVLIVVVGASLARWAHRHFLRHATNALPWRPTNTLVPSGPYRFTRNPMYLGMAGILLGAAVYMGSITPFIVIPAFMALISERFIVPEEAKLEATFGRAYLDYKARVPRWL